MSYNERTIQDILISGLNNPLFSITEPPALWLARFRHKFKYRENSTPLISVYVPTYNRAKILMERAVPSVLAQSYSNFEFIIIGDHCTDETEAEIAKIKDPRIRFYNLPTRGYRYPPTAENHWLAGPVVAANQALKMIRGDWIARIDDDDIWTVDHLASLLDFAQRGNFEFVSSLCEEERRGVRRVVAGERANGPYYNPKFSGSEDDSPRLGGPSTWLYRSYLKFFKYNIDCWRKKWNRVNDVDLLQRIYKARVRIGFLDKVTAYVLPRPGEQTVGLEAYRTQEKEKESHYKFSDS